MVDRVFCFWSMKSLFSFIVLLLNFLKYLISVSFPEFVMSAFKGFKLHLCQDLSCLMTGSRLW